MSLDHCNAVIAYDETDQGRVMAREVIRWPVTIDALAQWLRCRATNRKVSGSILDGVIRIFH